MSSNLSGYDCAKCPAESSNESGTEAGQQEAVGAGEELTNDQEEDDKGADDHSQQSRQLADAELYSMKLVEDQIEDLWWGLSVSEAYGTPGGFNG